MAATSFPSSVATTPRRRSLELESDVFGRHFPGLVRRSSYTARPASLLLPDAKPPADEDEHYPGQVNGHADEPFGTETFLQTRRGMRLIGENNNPRYRW